MSKYNGITLRELVNRQKLTGETDSELIAEWFTQNNMAVEGIDIVSKISKKKASDDEWLYGELVADMSMYRATKSLITEFGIKDGLTLDDIIREWIICNRLGKDFVEKYPQLMDWLKQNIHKHKQPIMFWQPFIKWMNEHNIYFKDQKEN